MKATLIIPANKIRDQSPAGHLGALSTYPSHLLYLYTSYIQPTTCLFTFQAIFLVFIHYCCTWIVLFFNLFWSCSIFERLSFSLSFPKEIICLPVNHYNIISVCV